MTESTQTYKPVQLNKNYSNLVVGSSALLDTNTNIIIDDVCVSEDERQRLESLHRTHTPLSNPPGTNALS